MKITSTFLNRKRAQQFKVLRTGLIGQLYPTQLTSTIELQNNQVLLLSDLVSSFKRFAGNQQTTYDNRPISDQQITYDGSGQPSATTTANRLARQVDNAIALAFRKAPGRVATNFIDALDAAFPSPNNGQLVALPTRSQNLLLNPNNDNRKSLEELSTRQLGLYRQTSVIATDALKILDELQTFVSEADIERFEALRSLIQSQIVSLVEEFGRADEPRSVRVVATLRSLQEYVIELGEQGHFNDPLLAATISDDDQIAKFDVLINYVKLISRSWSEYYNAEKSGRVYSISERADRARVILPIVSQANQDLSNALESVGLTPSERRSRAYLFTTLQSPLIELPENNEGRTVVIENQISAWLPDITVSDLQDWLARFANMEAPNALNSVYGIDFVTDQADRLFWTIAPIVAHIKTTRSLNPGGQSTLAQILSNERVSLAFDNLLSQLNALADLAV
ncbi:hypothetical protein VB713_17905 [Anabaena cylindrica UHCC 0172]|uniref:hypothetical protein n=1 Tax=Anabaena cylindrica TaxID=1165 RepID=UPI002B1F0E46|nr:hypothetical protein [Anabaena cylindrica]MEA5552821.1 hypothetical protein [Anabaena cylindrica UHCC 0172]